MNIDKKRAPFDEWLMPPALAARQSERAILLLLAVFIGGGCSSEGTPGQRTTSKASAAGSSAAGSDANGSSAAGSSAAGSSAAGSEAGGSDMGASHAGGSSGGTAQGPDPLPRCVSERGFICQPSGFPFVGTTWAFSDICDGADCPLLTEPEPGTLCLSGAAPVPGARPHFPLILIDGRHMPPLDAAALGITQLSFTIDSPPPPGVFVGAGMVVETGAGCFENPRNCQRFFELARITEDGPHIAAFSDAVQLDAASSYQVLDLRVLGSILFGVYDAEFGVNEGEYRFCVRDFKFLNDAGDEVTPAPP
jgi:hypothetical protein